MQTAAGTEVYPSLEEKAAQLLYMVVKNHAFVDGNKRIAAALFLWDLAGNGALTTGLGQVVISNATLVAVTLLIPRRSQDTPGMAEDSSYILNEVWSAKPA